MKLHRYYLKDQELPHDFWMQDKELFYQWTKVLRYQLGREVVLFNQEKEERLYKIIKIGNDAIHLQLVTELEPKIPEKDLYLCFSLLKKDKNEWILQKATELGVRHFIPILADRTEKTGFDNERAEKIVIEASEQCGRTDIPKIRESLTIKKVIEELNNKVDLYVAEQGEVQSSNINYRASQSLAVLIGPEGGWSDEELELFKENNLKFINLGEFTLRAETAAITAVTKIL